MSFNYLDFTGLTTYNDEIQKEFSNLIALGTCPTVADTAAKAITITGNNNWELKTGSIIIVTFTYTNTANNPTFSVNNSTAKSVWLNTGVITSSNLAYAGTANRPSLYMYNGTNWVFLCWSKTDANDTYTNVKLGQGYATCDTAAATAAKTAALSSYALTTGGIVVVKFTNDVPANATLNVNSKGAKAIYYKGAAITAGVIKAGDTAYFMYDTYYYLLGVDRTIDNMVSITNNEIDALFT